LAGITQLPPDIIEQPANKGQSGFAKYSISACSSAELEHCLLQMPDVCVVSGNHATGDFEQIKKNLRSLMQKKTGKKMRGGAATVKNVKHVRIT
jgi:hypothetical protein